MPFLSVCICVHLWANFRFFLLCVFVLSWFKPVFSVFSTTGGFADGMPLAALNWPCFLTISSELATSWATRSARKPSSCDSSPHSSATPDDDQVELLGLFDDHIDRRIGFDDANAERATVGWDR